MTAEALQLQDAFLRWQCRVRQICMRDRGGRPDDGVMPEVTLKSPTSAPSRNFAPVGTIVTVLNKRPEYSKTPELRHIVKHTLDPAQRRDKAVQLFSETYFQKAAEFSDVLTSSFPEGSGVAKALCEAGSVGLKFEAYAQIFSLTCKVHILSADDPLREATWWHNHLFNPNLSSEAVILGFLPDWEASVAQPEIGRKA